MSNSLKGHRKKVGLALGSGGARGISHIGVLKSLVKNNIPIDFIAGASAGSVIGGMYAAKKDISSLEKFWLNVDIKEAIKVFLDPGIQSGVFKGSKMVQFLDNYLEGIDTADTQIPFTAVATNIKTGQICELKNGHLANNIRASSSVPLMFSPTKIKDKYLVDGGVAAPVPAQAVRDMGADIVIAVNVDSVFFSDKSNFINKQSLSIYSIANSSYYMLRYHLAKENCKHADIVIEPKVPERTLIGILRAVKIIELGEKATDKLIPKIKKLI